MKIVIVGAGAVGYNIANRLASEDKQVVVIDTDEKAIHRLSETLDVKTITGSGSSPEVLTRAGVKDADMFLAVTQSDEINLVACLMTHLISPATKKLARIRNSELDAFHPVFKSETPHIDTIINPEIEVVKTIQKLMVVPRAVDVGTFVDGQVTYAGIHIDSNSPMVGGSLMDFPGAYGENRPLIAAIIRNNEVIVPRGKDCILSGDIIYFICETAKLKRHLKLFGLALQPIRNVLIVGGGRIGERLAGCLEKKGVKTKIIEADQERCHDLSSRLAKTIVLHGDGSDQTLFREENIRLCDAVISVTDDDETNILISLLAENQGVTNTITRIGKPGYFPLLSTIGIQKVVSPRLSAISSILHEVRKGKVLSDISIFGEKGEFIEAVAIKDSGIIERPIKRLKFPKGALLVCIIRDSQVIIPTGDSVIDAGDRIILFTKKQAVKKLEALLTVKIGFF